MSRPDASSYDFTDAEKRDLIKLIEQGKPLPEKYSQAPIALLLDIPRRGQSIDTLAH